MGILENIFGTKKEEINLDLDSQLAEIDAMPQEPADLYVVRLDLGSDGRTDAVMTALAEKKIVLSGISKLLERPERVKSVIVTLKAFISKTGGDMVLLNKDMLILTPSRIKVMRTKKAGVR